MRHWLIVTLAVMLSAGAAWADSGADTVQVPAPVIEEAHGDAAETASDHVAGALSELQGAVMELRAALETLQALRGRDDLAELAEEARDAVVLTRKAVQDARTDELRTLAESVSEDVDVRVQDGRIFILRQGADGECQEIELPNVPDMARDVERRVYVVRQQAEEVADEARVIMELDAEMAIVPELAELVMELDGEIVRLTEDGLVDLESLDLAHRCPTCGQLRMEGLPELEELEGLRVLRQRVGEAGSEARVIIQSEDLGDVLDLRGEIEGELAGIEALRDAELTELRVLRESLDEGELAEALERIGEEIAERVAEAVSEALAQGGLETE